jgi:pentatricopeptide repeat protein
MEKYAEMQERGLTPNVVTYTSLIRAWGQSHHPQRVWCVFDTMIEAGEKPNVITFSSLIQAAERCQNPEKGLRVYVEMEEAGIAPSSYTYDNLKKCWRNQRRSRALAAIRMMEDEGKPPSKSACSAVMRNTVARVELPKVFDS